MKQMMCIQTRTNKVMLKYNSVTGCIFDSAVALHVHHLPSQHSYELKSLFTLTDVSLVNVTVIPADHRARPSVHAATNNVLSHTETMANAQSALTFAICVFMITELILAKKDYYDILGVPKEATERQIKKAFHKLAMRYHPDKNKSPDAEMKFREIAEGMDIIFLHLNLNTTQRLNYCYVI